MVFTKVDSAVLIVEMFSLPTDGKEDTDSTNGSSVVEFKTGKSVESVKGSVMNTFSLLGKPVWN